MKKNAFAMGVVCALSLVLVSCGGANNNTDAYQHVEEQSFTAETEKPTEYEMSSQDSSEHVTSKQEIDSGEKEVKESSVPFVTKKSQATVDAETTMNPQATECPVVNNNPQATECPVVNNNSQATECPVVTNKPQTTECPVVNNKPQATKSPECTKRPQATANPTVVPTTKPTTKPTTNPTTKPTTKPTNTPGSSSEVNTDAYIAEVLKIVNKERAKEGLNPLTTNTKLKNAANQRAKEIVSLFSHTRPDGTSGVSVLKEYGISYSAWGENIAYGQKSPAVVMDAWMNSSGHRANILSNKFGKVGIGCYVKNGVIYWTQVFTN